MKLTLAFIFIMLTATFGYSQQPECPAGLVCLTPEAARAALEAGDAKKALEKQVTALEEALRKSQESEHKMALEYARTAGENTILKQQQIRSDALLDLALKQTKKKRNGFITIF